MDKIKHCCIRIPSDLHRRAKAYAYKKGVTLQDWITFLIEEELPEEKEENIKLCIMEQRPKKHG